MVAALTACGRSEIPAAESAVAGSEPTLFRYSLVAKFDGAFPVLADGGGLTEVEDRFEIIFDLDGERIVGEPLIANSGSRLVEPGAEAPGCDAPERTSYFDRAELQSAAVDDGLNLRLTIDTHLSGYKAPEGCADGTQTVEPRQEQSVLTLAIPHAELKAAEGGPVETRMDGWTFSFSRRPIDTGERQSSP